VRGDPSVVARPEADHGDAREVSRVG
jgi:hypothetical protein